ncbi:endonuclease [Polaribacter cellanae]|uniref:Endonuclease n=1 Tax=Polaribacter cellanae TaxID=2818493 RepID=A0A975CN62_9FLAO|nr:endonuclease [Polaribacter cellanae]QTE23001.1 endonuclease [Polaribacter cellanae]
MKQKLLFLITFLTISLGFAQIPSGYYSNATGSGYTLKTQLKSIISNGHIDNGYGALYDAYVKTDNDSFYEKDNTVLDMYSENPSGADAYNYNHKQRNCGNYNSENDCYNREHIFPQGFFNKRTPMRTDIHHVVPADGYINGRRSNYPFGEVTSATFTSNNGSKIGQNTFGNHSGTVFEPINEFKGDIARMLLYFATRYEDEVTSNSWDAPNASVNNPLNGTNNQVYENWYIQLLYKWHTQDPVSNREIVRNNEAYKFQGNRNPFIDHPEYVSEIWSSVLSIKQESLLEDISIYPNPSTINRITITIPNDLKINAIVLYNVIGATIYKTTNPTIANQKIRIKDLKKGFYILKISSDTKSLSKKIIIQ